MRHGVVHLAGDPQSFGGDCLRRRPGAQRLGVLSGLVDRTAHQPGDDGDQDARVIGADPGAGEQQAAAERGREQQMQRQRAQHHGQGRARGPARFGGGDQAEGGDHREQRGGRQLELPAPGLGLRRGGGEQQRDGRAGPAAQQGGGEQGDRGGERRRRPVLVDGRHETGVGGAGGRRAGRTAAVPEGGPEQREAPRERGPRAGRYPPQPGREGRRGRERL